MQKEASQVNQSSSQSSHGVQVLAFNTIDMYMSKEPFLRHEVGIFSVLDF